MVNVNARHWFATILIIVIYLATMAYLSSFAHVMTGKEVVIDDLHIGESFTVAALSPSVEEAEVIVSTTGEASQTVAIQEGDDFVYRVVALGEDVVITSEEVMKVSVYRGPFTMVWAYVYLAIPFFLIWMVLVPFLWNTR